MIHAIHLSLGTWSSVAAALRETRQSQVYEVACSAPENRRLRLALHVDDALSSLDRWAMAPGAQPKATVPVFVMTLDDILVDAGAPISLDLLSIDVEGHELDVLRGFDIDKWRPRLLLLEDHVSDLTKHRYMMRRGYALSAALASMAGTSPPIVQCGSVVATPSR